MYARGPVEVISVYVRGPLEVSVFAILHALEHRGAIGKHHFLKYKRFRSGHMSGGLCKACAYDW